MHKKISFILLFLLKALFVNAQAVKTVPVNGAPENIIIIIASGTGLNQLQAATLKKGAPLNLSKFPVLGFSQPWPANGKMPNDSTMSAIGTNRSKTLQR